MPVYSSNLGQLKSIYLVPHAVYRVSLTAVQSMVVFPLVFFLSLRSLMTYPICVCVCVCCEYLFLTVCACYISLFLSPSRAYFSLWLHVSRLVTDYRCLTTRIGKSLIDFLPIWMQHCAVSLSFSCIIFRKLFHLILILFLFDAFEYIHCCLDYYSLRLRVFIHWVSFYLTRNRSDICIWHMIWYTFI